MKMKFARTGAIVAMSALAVTGFGVTSASATDGFTSGPVIAGDTTTPPVIGVVITTSTLTPEARQAILDQIVVLKRQLHPVKATKAEKAAVKSAIADLLRSLKPVHASHADRVKAQGEIRVLVGKKKASKSAVERTAIRAEVKATLTRVAPVKVTPTVRKAVLDQIAVLRQSIEPKKLTSAERMVIETQVHLLVLQLAG